MLKNEESFTKFHTNNVPQKLSQTPCVWKKKLFEAQVQVRFTFNCTIMTTDIQSAQLQGLDLPKVQQIFSQIHLLKIK